MWKEHWKLKKFKHIQQGHKNFMIYNTRDSFWNFCISIVLLFWIQKIKNGLLSNHFFERQQEHSGWTKPQGNDKFL